MVLKVFVEEKSINFCVCFYCVTLINDVYKLVHSKLDIAAETQCP